MGYMDISLVRVLLITLVGCGVCGVYTGGNHYPSKAVLCLWQLDERSTLSSAIVRGSTVNLMQLL